MDGTEAILEELRRLTAEVAEVRKLLAARGGNGGTGGSAGTRPALSYSALGGEDVYTVQIIAGRDGSVGTRMKSGAGDRYRCVIELSGKREFATLNISDEVSKGETFLEGDIVRMRGKIRKDEWNGKFYLSVFANEVLKPGGDTLPSADSGAPEEDVPF